MIDVKEKEPEKPDESMCIAIALQEMASEMRDMAMIMVHMAAGVCEKACGEDQCGK